MKKINLLLLAVVLSLGYLSAQLGTGRPELSTDDSGPWYFIKGRGNEGAGARTGKVLVAEEDPHSAEWLGEDMLRVYNRELNVDELDAQLWRFQQVDEGPNGAVYMKIVNKLYEGLVMDQYLIGAYPDWNDPSRENNMNKWFVRLSEDGTTRTDWEIIDSKDGDTNYFHILATEPGDETRPSMHMANHGYWWGVIFEGDFQNWGYGVNSQFFFQKYVAGYTVDKVEVDFGIVPEDFDSNDEANAKEFTITTLFGITGEYEIDYDDTNFFITTYANSETSQLVCTVYFDPQDGPGSYSTEVTIKNSTEEGPQEEKVILKGTVYPKAPIKPSPAIANSDEDTWYSLFFDQVSTNYMTDNGLETMIGVSPGVDENNPATLWKFVSIADNDTAFRLVSQLGNMVEYKIKEVETEDGVEEEGRFYTSSNSEHTFSFGLITSTGRYVLQWNEYSVESEDPETGLPILTPTRTYINKIENENGFTQDTRMTNAGSSVLFFEKGSGEYLKLNVKFSNGDDEDTLYYLRFHRTAVTKDQPQKAFWSQGVNNPVVQYEVTDPSDPYLWWKFVGTWDNFKIVDVEGNELGAITSGEEAVMEAPGEGAYYRMNYFKTTEDLEFECLADVSVNARYLNDLSGFAEHLSAWTKNDDGNRLFVTPLNQWEWPVSIETPGTSVEDPIVNSVYYTIQGVQLAKKPTAPGLYVKKNTHESSKVSAETIYIVK